VKLDNIVLQVCFKVTVENGLFSLEHSVTSITL